MNRRRLAWSLWGLCLALALVSLTFLALNGSTTHSNTIGEPVVDALFGLLYLVFPSVGLAIALRQPGNAIGWLFLAAGLGAQLEDAALGYGTNTLLKEPGSLPGGPAAGLIADVGWVPTMAAGISLLLLLFPTGRPPSRRWNLLIWVVALAVAAYVVGTLLNPGRLYFFEDVRNPLGVEAGDDVIGPVVDFVGGPFLLTTVAAVVALILRFHRSSGVEREQLKWLAYTAAVLVALTPVMVLTGDAGVEVAGVLVSDFLYGLMIGTIPLAVGAAILRHRLYDIGVVINRTVVYGGLTVTLAAAYLGSVLLLQLVLSPLTEQSDLAIAGSTLAVAALVRPARRRIQELVDRRFFRRKYDAARTLERFGAHLRDQVALDSLGAELRGVVADTMQPAHVSLWLRAPEARR
jgi:hypothetical protein